VLSEAERGAEPVSAVPASEDISLLEIIIVIARRRTLILGSAFAMALLGVVISLLLPTLYIAETTILPPQQDSSSGAALMAQLGNLGSVASLAGGSLGLKNPNDLQVALLKSRTVEDAMVDRFGLMVLYHAKHRSDARKHLETIAEISNGAKDGLIHIAVTDHDPRRAAELANAYVEEFKKFSATLAVTSASQRRLFFEGQLGQAKDKLANAEEDLKRTEQRTGVVELDGQTRMTIELVSELRGEIAAKEVQIRSMQSFATSENPELQSAQQQLVSLRTQLEKMGASSEGASNALIPKGNMQESGLEYIRGLRDVKYYQTIYEMLARQYEVAKVDEARQGAVVQTVDPAIVPDSRSSPKRTLIVLGFTALGLFLGIVWTLAGEGMNRLAGDAAERSRMVELKRLLSFPKS